ncbi:FYVE, RhoGEF and PH domain-containing protein 4-like [Sycon ciliatum]|uniref:FYVE, RhoGEF and PH domain-containing protein 4-like n=1 Tax=Sycon ciliatum TaxID=27933 RepID=UPI0020A98EC2|eukprot:scpid36477/ scgid30978/ FYVE, RhoGEF and PH domain-containing protein 4; Actin filament-binding protein frabin; FGD1-related F-actin-binding protein; Zinc finger FYVE domain-containing protein 6
MAAPPPKPSRPNKPSIKPKPSEEAIRAARAKSLTSVAPANQFFPTGLSGESSPSTPPRRPPPSVPVPATSVAEKTSDSENESKTLTGTADVDTHASETDVTIGNSDADAKPSSSPPLSATDGRQTGRRTSVSPLSPVSPSIPESKECEYPPMSESYGSSNGAEGDGDGQEHALDGATSETGVKAVRSDISQNSNMSLFSSSSEMDSDNEENCSVASGETSPPEEIFYGMVAIKRVVKEDEASVKEEEEDVTKTMTKEEKQIFKMRKTAEELMTTEQSYVAGLKLLAKDLKEILEKAQRDGACKGLDAEKMKFIFGVLPEIYGIHVRMLDELTQRIANWDLNPKIGDIMSEFAPFLRVYGNFTMNFEQAVKTVSDMAKSDKKFKSLIQDFERQPECKMLGISHYMLTPVQRIPRYNLLLREYLKWAPEDYPDRPGAEKSLEDISVAADKANQQIKELENFNKVMMVQLSIVDKIDLVQPGAALIRHGPLMKASRKLFHNRYFFLFNNKLIHATSVTNQPFGEGGQYRVRALLPVSELRVEAKQVSPLPHAFTILSKARSICVAASSAEEKEEWMQDIASCTEKWRQIQTTRFNKGEDGEVIDGGYSEDSAQRLGKVAPVWLHDSSTSMCMVCAQQFSTFRRRHHCRCCGKVCCSNCSSREMFLEYSGKKDRVCDKCFYHLSGQDDSEVDKRKGKTVPGVREVKGYDEDSVLTGYLHLKSGLRWKRFWFQVRDLALFWFRAPEDVVAQGSKPLPGHVVECIKKGSHGSDREHSFRIFHKSIGTILLAGETDDERERWVTVLTNVIKGVSD